MVRGESSRILSIDESKTKSLAQSPNNDIQDFFVSIFRCVCFKNLDDNFIKEEFQHALT
jgi:hypothetical protein